MLIIVPPQGKYLCFYIANLMVNKYTFATRAFSSRKYLLLCNITFVGKCQCFAIGLFLYACASLKTFRIRKQGPRH